MDDYEGGEVLKFGQLNILRKYSINCFFFQLSYLLEDLNLE